MSRWKSFKLWAGQMIGTIVASGLAGAIAAEVDEPGGAERLMREIGVFSDRADFLQWQIGIALANSLLAVWCWKKRRVRGRDAEQNKISARTTSTSTGDL